MIKKITPKERKEATAELKRYHEDTFKKLGIEDPAFIPKMAYAPAELDGLHMGFFTSELDNGVDVYTEKVSRYMESEDPMRTLYKWKYNPHFKSEYYSETISGGSIRHFIPLDEMEIVNVENYSAPNEKLRTSDIFEEKDALVRIADALESIATTLANRI